MSTTLQKQILIDALELIASPEHWTTGTLACRGDGEHVPWADRSASRWCAMGAIYRAAYDRLGDTHLAARIGNDVIKTITPPGESHLRGYLPTLNDQQGHAAVLAAFDRASCAA